MKKMPLVFIIGLLLALASCTPKPILIGLGGPLTGPNSQLGIDGRNAAELFVTTINKQGGLLGRHLELVVFDDKNDLAVAESEALALFDKGAVFVVGHYLSSMVPAIQKVMDQRECLYLSPTISLASLSGIDDEFIRSYPAATVQARAMASEIIARGGKKVVLVHETGNGLYTIPLNSELRYNLESAGITILGDVPFTSGTEGHAELSEDILSLKPDSVFLSMSGLDAAQVAQQLKKRFDGPLALYGPNWPQTSDLIANGGRAVEGMVVCSLTEADPPQQAYVDFVDAYKTSYGKDPGFASYLTYELLVMVQKSLEANPRPLSPVGIKESILATSKFGGIQAPFVIDSFGDATKVYRILEIKDGDYVVVGER